MSGELLVKTFPAILLGLLGLACASASEELDERLVDLSYPFDTETIYWPTARAFALERIAWGQGERGWWYASSDYSASEHGGTHLDAPVHFGQGKRATDEIPLRQLVGPARVIDVTAACERDRDYLVSAADVEAHERVHGRIPAGAVVLVRTGWGRFWPDAARYLGSAARGDASDLHFPGIGPDAARLLVARGVDLVGIDTASMDRGASKDFETHRILAAADVPGLENVAHLDDLPPTGATIVALPMKIAGGTGGPCRIAAILPERR